MVPPQPTRVGKAVQEDDWPPLPRDLVLDPDAVGVDPAHLQLPQLFSSPAFGCFRQRLAAPASTVGFGAVRQDAARRAAYPNGVQVVRYPNPGAGGRTEVAAEEPFHRLFVRAVTHERSDGLLGFPRCDRIQPVADA